MRFAPSAAFRRDRKGNWLARQSRLGRDVCLGHGITVYPACRLGDHCVVLDGAVLGRLPIGNRTTTLPVPRQYEPLTIGPDSIIGAHTVLYTGSQFGRNVLVADLASIRERCQVGDGVVIGRGVMILSGCRIGGASRIQDQAHLAGGTVIEEDVFIGMGVITTNDNGVYLSRFGLVAPDLAGPTVRRGAVIGAGAVLLPGVEIGVGAMVGAGALVTRSVPSWTVVVGAPARKRRAIAGQARRALEARWASPRGSDSRSR